MVTPTDPKLWVELTPPDGRKIRLEKEDQITSRGFDQNMKPVMYPVVISWFGFLPRTTDSKGGA